MLGNAGIRGVRPEAPNATIRSGSVRPRTRMNRFNPTKTPGLSTVCNEQDFLREALTIFPLITLLWLSSSCGDDEQIAVEWRLLCAAEGAASRIGFEQPVDRLRFAPGALRQAPTWAVKSADFSETIVFLSD